MAPVLARSVAALLHLLSFSPPSPAELPHCLRYATPGALFSLYFGHSAPYDVASIARPVFLPWPLFGLGSRVFFSLPRRIDDIQLSGFYSIGLVIFVVFLFFSNLI